MTDLERMRLSTRVLDLLDASATAHAEGRSDDASALIREACELDVVAVSVIQGGIVIGQIPHPHRAPAEWAEYVAAQHDALVAAEARGGE